RRLMWFSYNNEKNWHSIDCDRAEEITELNAKGIKPFSLMQDKASEAVEDLSRYNRDLEMLDKKYRGQVKKKKKRKPKKQKNNEAKPEVPDYKKTEKTNKREKSKKNRTGRKNADNRNKAPQDQAAKPVSPIAGAPESKDKEIKSNKKRDFNRNRGKGGQNKGN